MDKNTKVKDGNEKEYTVTKGVHPMIQHYLENAMEEDGEEKYSSIQYLVHLKQTKTMISENLQDNDMEQDDEEKESTVVIKDGEIKQDKVMVKDETMNNVEGFTEDPHKKCLFGMVEINNTLTEQLADTAKQLSDLEVKEDTVMVKDEKKTKRAYHQLLLHVITTVNMMRERFEFKWVIAPLFLKYFPYLEYILSLFDAVTIVRECLENARKDDGKTKGTFKSFMLHDSYIIICTEFYQTFLKVGVNYVDNMKIKEGEEEKKWFMQKMWRRIRALSIAITLAGYDQAVVVKDAVLNTVLAAWNSILAKRRSAELVREANRKRKEDTVVGGLNPMLQEHLDNAMIEDDEKKAEIIPVLVAATQMFAVIEDTVVVKDETMDNVEDRPRVAYDKLANGMENAVKIVEESVNEIKKEHESITKHKTFKFLTNVLDTLIKVKKNVVIDKCLIPIFTRWNPHLAMMVTVFDGITTLRECMDNALEDSAVLPSREGYYDTISHIEEDAYIIFCTKLYQILMKVEEKFMDDIKVKDGEQWKILPVLKAAKEAIKYGVKSVVKETNEYVDKHKTLGPGWRAIKKVGGIVFGVVEFLSNAYIISHRTRISIEFEKVLNPILKKDLDNAKKEVGHEKDPIVKFIVKVDETLTMLEEKLLDNDMEEDGEEKEDTVVVKDDKEKQDTVMVNNETMDNVEDKAKVAYTEFLLRLHETVTILGKKLKDNARIDGYMGFHGWYPTEMEIAMGEYFQVLVHVHETLKLVQDTVMVETIKVTSIPNFELIVRACNSLGMLKPCLDNAREEDGEEKKVSIYDEMNNIAKKVYIHFCTKLYQTIMKLVGKLMDNDKENGW